MGPPLLLEHSFFTKVAVEADPDYVPGSDVRPHDYAVQVNSQMAHSKSDPAVWKIDLCIQLRRDGTPAPYTVDLQVVGIFRVAAEWDPERASSLVRVTGSSILYSAAREYLLVLSGRLAWGEVQLPPWTFISESRSPPQRDACGAETPTKKTTATSKARRRKGVPPSAGGRSSAGAPP